jgi:hypothetical protein
MKSAQIPFIIVGWLLLCSSFARTFEPSERDVTCMLERTEYISEKNSPDTFVWKYLPYTVTRRAILDSGFCAEIADKIRASNGFSKNRHCEASRGDSTDIKVFIGIRSYRVTFGCQNGFVELVDEDRSLFQEIILKKETTKKLDIILDKISRANRALKDSTK